MSGHTPGPWLARQAKGLPPCVTNAEGEVIAFVERLPHKPGQGTANLALITATPDLLEACEGLIAAIRQGNGLLGADGSMSLPLQRALEATAKARGGTQ